MEFKMTTDLATALPAEIGFNFEELKTELTARIDYYNSLVITEDTIKEGKADRAKLNKLREAIETRRKEIKKLCMAPYTAFEVKVKELVALIDQPIGAIDSQLQRYEEMRREERRQQVAGAYDTIVPEDLRDIIPLDTIFSPKWMNATTTMKAVEGEISDRVKRTNADMMVLNTVEPEYSAAVREVYIRTLDIEKAMSHRNALQAAAEAFKAREASKAAQQAAPATEAKIEQKSAPVATPAQSERLYVLRLEMNLTMAQADELKEFLTEKNIAYTKI